MDHVELELFIIHICRDDLLVVSLEGASVLFEGVQHESCALLVCSKDLHNVYVRGTGRDSDPSLELMHA